MSFIKNQICQSLTDYEQNLEDQQQCMFCQAKLQQFPKMIQSALFGKHSSSQNFYYTRQINQIINQQLTKTYAQFHQFQVLDDWDQFLKRQYQAKQYNKKIKGLGQYYKYHNEVPRFFGMPIEKTMGRYYDKKRDYEYKKIKRALKEQENLDMQESQSENSQSFHSSYVKKSKYSYLLIDLKKQFQKQDQILIKNKRKKQQQNFNKSQSLALLQIYQKLNQLTIDQNQNFQLTGSYLFNNGQQNFEKWIKKNIVGKPNKLKIEKKNFKKVKNQQSTTKIQKTNKFQQQKKRRTSFAEKVLVNNHLNIQIKNSILQKKNSQIENIKPKPKILKSNKFNPNIISKNTLISQPHIKNNHDIFNIIKIISDRTNKQPQKQNINPIMSNQQKNMIKFMTLNTQRQHKKDEMKQQKNKFTIFDSKKKSNSVGKILLRPELKTIRKQQTKQKQKQKQKSKDKIGIKYTIKNRTQSVPILKNQLKMSIQKPKIQENQMKKPSFLDYFKQENIYQPNRNDLQKLKKRNNYDPAQLYKRLKGII